MANDSSFYYDFNYSLPLVQLILKMLGKGDDPTQSQLTGDSNREWFGQSRVGTDSRTECVTVNFRLPLSVSEINTEIVRMPCTVEVWYQDRSNNWRPVLTEQRTPMKVRVDRGDTKSWYKWGTRCYPIVAKKVQLRLTRYADGVLDNIPYPMGVRNTLIRRNVYDRAQGGFFEDELDIMGNTVSKYVRDWDASKAADDNYTTFWKSAPQPDPAAVVSLFLDVRAEDGTAQVIDKVYIDPVYAGQHLNLYYSSDATVGTRTLSPITLPPPVPLNKDRPTVFNTEWRFDRGLTDTSTDPAESLYSWPLNVGGHVDQDAWIGVCWKPDFASTNDPNLAHNPTLFAAATPDSDTAKPVLIYDPTLRAFVLTLFHKNKSGDVVAVGNYVSSSISQEWAAGDAIKIVAGWRYGTQNKVWITVVDSRGRVIASLDNVADALPSVVSFGGTARVSNFRGTITALVVKLESHLVSSAGFLANPAVYCEPDPVLPDNTGKYPATTLDNAIYSAPFLTREHGSGGSDQSHFEDKEWTPIWRDYTAAKGMLFLPQAIAMKYLKLEFTNLTEQPYPIYESGIDVTYKVFPVSITQTSSIGPRLYTGTGGFLGMGTFISMNGVRSVNWLDPTSVMQAIGAVAGQQIPPVVINTGSPYLTSTLPNMGMTAIQQSRSVEAASSYVYARDIIQPYVLAQNQYNTIIKAEGLQAIQPFVDIPWEEIEAANPDTVTKVKSTGTVPMRGSDWWIYPGQQLKVPASVMRKITDTQTVTERKLTLESRSRFNTTCVHRYDFKTVRRDSAIAYFAGLREVQPYTSTFIAGEDSPSYDFPSYTGQHWTLDNITRYQNDSGDNGPITAKYPAVYGVATSKDLVSQSEFSKVTLSFQDSGLARSNSMWVDINQTTETVDDTQLSPYFGVIPSSIPKGNWADALANWSDGDAAWGSSYGLVSINVDNNRKYLGKRVVHFTRAAGAGQAGISLDQWLNFSPGAKFRIGATFYRPKATGNNIILRLKRNDGTIVLEETLGTPRIIATSNIDINAPGSVINGTTLIINTLVYLNAQDDPGQDGLYRFRSATLPLQPVAVSTGDSGDSTPSAIANTSIDINSPGASIGVTSPAVGDLIYLSAQTRPAENGLYRFKGATTPLVEVNANASGTVDPGIFKSVGYAPSGRWTNSVTAFAEIPETLSNSSFDNTLFGWIPDGGTWTAVSDKGYTGLKSAKLTTNGTESTLATEPVECLLNTTVSASAWVNWSGLTTTADTIFLRAVFYNTAGDVVSIPGLDVQGATQVPQNASTGSLWNPVTTSVKVPDGLGITQVAFELVVPASVGSGGSVWVDDFATDIPGTPRQQYTAELTIEGNEEEELYVSDLYTETTPIRYFVQTGNVTTENGETVKTWNDPIEVTDLRHTKNQAIVTTTDPANSIQVQTVITTDRAYAFGCKITPNYLK